MPVEHKIKWLAENVLGLESVPFTLEAWTNGQEVKIHWNPYENIKDAWMLMEKLSTIGNSIQLHNFENFNEVKWTMNFENKRVTESATSESAPEAIATAIYKAMGGP